SVRRLERFLTLIWDSGATPILALTKVDLVSDAGPFLREVEKCALGFPVLCISSLSGQGFDELRALITPGETIVLLGSSGVGKSSLINALSGTDVRKTRAIRKLDGKGGHATSDRHLLQLPSGVLLIDTPDCARSSFGQQKEPSTRLSPRYRLPRNIAAFVTVGTRESQDVRCSRVSSMAKFIPTG